MWSIEPTFRRTAEDISQETVRILKGSHKPKDNLTGAERRALRSLKANEVLTVLPADMGNATVVLNTLDYNRRSLLSWRTRPTRS
jgi:hypothetical protein